MRLTQFLVKRAGCWRTLSSSGFFRARRRSRLQGLTADIVTTIGAAIVPPKAGDIEVGPLKPWVPSSIANATRCLPFIACPVKRCVALVLANG